MKKASPNIWDNLPFLIECERLRDEHRKSINRLTFDCYNAKAKADRVSCSKWHRLGSASDGTAFLGGVLKGRTVQVCRDCADFNGD